jgi:hypothetical protein
MYMIFLHKSNFQLEPDKVRKGPATGFKICTVSFVQSKISMKQSMERMCFAYVYDWG